MLLPILTNSELFKSSYVSKNGKINPWGTLHLLSEGTEDDLDNPDKGLTMWSEKLIPYGNGLFTAKAIEGCLVVFSGEKKVISFEPDEFEIPRIHTTEVLPSCYINSHWSLSMERWKREIGSGTREHMIKTIQNVLDGNQPTHYDDAPFIKVSPNLIGTSLVEIMTVDDVYKLYNQNGEAVPFTREYLLSKDYWVNR